MPLFYMPLKYSKKETMSLNATSVVNKSMSDIRGTWAILWCHLVKMRYSSVDFSCHSNSLSSWAIKFERTLYKTKTALKSITKCMRSCSVKTRSHDTV